MILGYRTKSQIDRITSALPSISKHHVLSNILHPFSMHIRCERRSTRRAHAQRLNLLSFDKMISSSICSLHLPYVGLMNIGQCSSTSLLLSLQKPLRDLFSSIHETETMNHRIILSDEDLLICEAKPTSDDKSNLIYAKLNSLIYAQTLKLSTKISADQLSIEIAFLPIGEFVRFVSFFFQFFYVHRRIIDEKDACLIIANIN